MDNTVAKSVRIINTFPCTKHPAQTALPPQETGIAERGYGRVCIVTIGICLLSTGSAHTTHAATLVLEQDYSDASTLESFWLTPNACGKRLVGSEDGANVISGICLRCNWRNDFTDPITGLTSAAGPSSRYSNIDIPLASLGISDELWLSYDAYLDPEVYLPIGDGMKWLWFNGTAYPSKFNHIINVFNDFNSWRFTNNSAVGEPGGPTGNRRVLLDAIDGITDLRGALSVGEWFPGRWHKVQVYARLNTQGTANGILEFWLDGVKIFDVTDYLWRDLSTDNFAIVNPLTMFGGGSPPPASFGWQIDNVRVWDGRVGNSVAPSPPNQLRIQ